VPLTARARSGRGGRAAAECARLARSQLALRCPSFAEAPVVADRSGPIDITPDLCAIIDRVEPEGLYLAVGMSGSGFKKGPAIGQCVAELVLHGESRTVRIDRKSTRLDSSHYLTSYAVFVLNKNISSTYT